ncbi:MAG: hypothetical protein N3B16_04975 [Candidatus Aminicenantes bacterium]|nr:hypothetical protein [Candidatus Aminicenantes bacterium]
MNLNKLFNQKKLKYSGYFFIFFISLSFLYFKEFKGIQGDAYYYYSYAVSIVWDKDLDMKNQFDHPLPSSPTQTVTSSNYFIDAKTGRAFSFFNLGTGLLMTPLLFIGRIIDIIKGNLNEDPFSFHYQRIACYTNIILTSFATLFLFKLLKEFCSLGVAIIGPPIFLFGTNWLFYTVFFSGWSHAYSLALCIFGLWSFLKIYQKQNCLYASLFGFVFGLLFCIRNFNLLLFGFLLIISLVINKREGINEENAAKKTYEERNTWWTQIVHLFKGSPFNKKQLKFSLVALIFFLMGALPQFLYYHLTHGSPFVSSFEAAGKAIKPFFAPEAEHFRVIYLKNFFMLPSTLFNSENGLFYFHPLYLFGLLGFVLFKSTNLWLKITSWALFFSVYIYWFFDAAYFDTWFCRAAGAGFGHRRFLDLLPFFIIGGALFVERLRKNIFSRFLSSGLISFLLVASISFFHLFLNHFHDFYREKDSLIKFYLFLFKNWTYKLLFLVVWIAIYFLLSLNGKRENKEENKYLIKYQHPRVFTLIICLLLIPPLIFKGDPEWDRQRFKERQGFFLLYSPTPLIKIYGQEWLLPQDLGRQLVKKKAKIILPSPVRKGDIILFKITGSQKLTNEVAMIELWTDNIFQGSQRINPGKGIYLFPIIKETEDSRKIRIRINYQGQLSDFVFHEGKITFREQSRLPMGQVDLPKKDKILTSNEVWIEGWALDDWGIDRVEVRGKGLPKYEDKVNLDFLETSGEINLGEAEFLWNKRPDVEKVYVLYPDILRCGWKFRISRALLPKETRNMPLLIRVIAWDKEGNFAELGRKLFIWQD